MTAVKSIAATENKMGKVVITSQGEKKIVGVLARGYKLEGEKKQIQTNRFFMLDRQLHLATTEINEEDVARAASGHFNLVKGTESKYMKKTKAKAKAKDNKPAPKADGKKPRALSAAKQELLDEMVELRSPRVTRIVEVAAELFGTETEYADEGNTAKAKKLRAEELVRQIGTREIRKLLKAAAERNGLEELLESAAPVEEEEKPKAKDKKRPARKPKLVVDNTKDTDEEFEGDDDDNGENEWQDDEPISFDVPENDRLVIQDDGRVHIDLDGLRSTEGVKNGSKEAAELCRDLVQMASTPIRQVLQKMFTNIDSFQIVVTNVLKEENGSRTDEVVGFDFGARTLMEEGSIELPELDELMEVNDEALELLNEKITNGNNFPARIEKCLGVEWSDEPLLVTDSEREGTYLVVGATDLHKVKVGGKLKKISYTILQNIETGEIDIIKRAKDLQNDYIALEDFDMDDEDQDLSTMSRFFLMRYIVTQYENAGVTIKDSDYEALEDFVSVEELENEITTRMIGLVDADNGEEDDGEDLGESILDDSEMEEEWEGDEFEGEEEEEEGNEEEEEELEEEEEIEEGGEDFESFDDNEFDFDDNDFEQL